MRPAAAVLLVALALLPADRIALAQEHVTKDEAARQLQERKRQLETARQREQALVRDVDALAKERARLNEKLISTARRVQESEARLSAIEKRLRQLSDQERGVRASIEERRATIAKLLAAMQRIGHEPPPALVTRRDDALEMVRSAMLLAAIFPELKFQADSLSEDLKDLVRLGDGIRRERDALKSETATLAAERARITALVDEKKRKLALSQTELASIREAARRHAKEVTYLGELLQRMEKELAKAGLEQYERELALARERERERERERIAKQAPPAVELKPDEKQQVAFLSPGRIKPAIPFEKARAKLPRPAHGEAVLRFGDPEKHGRPSEGEWIRTRKDAQVTSPADGWVVYAGEFRSYGQLLIINAGGGYHVLLAGMKRIDVAVGQFVLASEPVAVMGAAASEKRNEAGDDRPILYIEFRKDGRPINPAPWWAEIPEKVQG